MTKKEWLQIGRLNWLLLIGTLTFFLIKGIRYALIGSLTPSIFILVIVLLLLLSGTSSPKWFKRFLKYWGVFLLLWAIGRFLVEILFNISPGITESHIRGQFTIFQNLISALFLIIGRHFIRQ